MARAIAECSNPKCKWPIYKGDEVWFKGKKLYCHIDCLMTSFKTKEEVTNGK